MALYNLDQDQPTFYSAQLRSKNYPDGQKQGFMKLHI